MGNYFLRNRGHRFHYRCDFQLYRRSHPPSVGPFRHKHGWPRSDHKNGCHYSNVGWIWAAFAIPFRGRLNWTQKFLWFEISHMYAIDCYCFLLNVNKLWVKWWNMVSNSVARHWNSDKSTSKKARCQDKRILKHGSKSIISPSQRCCTILFGWQIYWRWWVMFRPTGTISTTIMPVVYANQASANPYIKLLTQLKW